jgi:acyl-CoA thioesterase FadM
MIIARRERQVEWGDCDPARIVFNPRFFEWFDAQTALIFETAWPAEARSPAKARFRQWGLCTKAATDRRNSSSI